MKSLLIALALVLAPVLVFGADAPPWAFPARPPGFTPGTDDGTPKHVPGSAKTYTQAQIDSNAAAPDWFPEEHPPMPAVVAHGGGDAIPACAKCHLVSGLGHPESAGVAGLPAAYLLRQLGDFKSGVRKGQPMTRISQALSDEDARAASAWFAGLKPQPWVKVVESASVPQTFVGEGNMRVPAPGGGMEPLGNRIIEIPQDLVRARNRDPHSGFVAYVPRGSIAKGKALVETGGSGATIPCAICHGATLTGLAEVPSIAGRSPIYLFRQLYDLQTGDRAGTWTELMHGVVIHLDEGEMIAISAYVASREP